MPFKEGQPSLTGCLGEIPLKQVVKKQFIGGPYIRLYDYFATLSFQYESGAILGRAKRDKISTLVNMLVVPGAEVIKFVKFMQDQANERLERFRNELGKEPDTFYDFILFRELEKSLTVVGLSFSKVFEEYTRGNKEVVKVFDRKVSLKDAWTRIQEYGVEGIGFGSSSPELTEKMYRTAHESIGTDMWSEARAHGLTIPEEPTRISLEEQERTALQMVAAYTSQYYPELVDPLDLRGCLEEKQMGTKGRKNIKKPKKEKLEKLKKQAEKKK